MLLILRKLSNRLLEKARAHAAGTCLDPFHRTRLSINASYFLQIRIPYFGALVVCMTHLMANHRFLPADLTYSRHTQEAPLKKY